MLRRLSVAERGNNGDFSFAIQHVHRILDGPHLSFVFVFLTGLALHRLLSYSKVAVTFSYIVAKGNNAFLILQLTISHVDKMSTLTNKVAVVTGASKGIGAAIVRGLANAGSHVIFTYSSSGEQAQKLAAELVGEGKKVEARHLNVADAVQTRSVIEGIGQQYGTIDILVNNAGIFLGKAFTDLSVEDFDQIMGVNFRGVYAAVLYAQPYLPTGGRVITIGSNSADTSIAPGMTLYAASKSALVGLTRGLARDFGAKDITVNLLQPGPVDTDMNPAEGALADSLRAKMAIPKYGEPRDIAALVTFLASAEAKYITGSIITIDGGMNA
jgi:3-oxoacyl-[acyl-carrier protein] reductase